MNKNINKGKSYQLVLSKIKDCYESEDIFHLIGLIAASESIISDRLMAFLVSKKKNNIAKNKPKNSFFSFNDLIESSKSELETEVKIITKAEGKLESKNLYAELWAWKEKRNQVIHAVCKSNNPVSHRSINAIFAEVLATCINAHRIVRLVLKWSSENKRK